ncbi:uncharacterized protein METZ01_LOCUS252642 [marine metagenome]|uniref:Plastocyanin-like domain-containing protein n=1 Tax=marine metagenome TaxID=408172 RepID=A0A382IJP2_9ZZZZ
MENTMANRNNTLLLLGLSLVLTCLLAACTSREPEDRTFNLEVQDGILVRGNPPLQVNQGDGVTIVVDANEHISFHLHGYDLEQEAGPGKPAKLVFLANATGSFPFTIHVSKSSGTHEHTDPVSGCQGILPNDAPTPEIVLMTGMGHDTGEVKVSVELQNFSLMSDASGSKDVAGGHWHLFIDGKLVGMYATPETTITVEKAGHHQFMATLSDNAHCEYGISANVTVHVEEGARGEEEAHHKDDGGEIELGRLDVMP